MALNWYGGRGGLPTTVAPQLGGIMVSYNQAGQSNYSPGVGYAAYNPAPTTPRTSPSVPQTRATSQPTMQRQIVPSQPGKRFNPPVNPTPLPEPGAQVPINANDLWADYQQHLVPNGIGTELGTMANKGYNPVPDAYAMYSPEGDVIGSFAGGAPMGNSPYFVPNQAGQAYGGWLGESTENPFQIGIKDPRTNKTIMQELKPDPREVASQLWKRQAFEGNTSLGRLMSQWTPDTFFLGE